MGVLEKVDKLRRGGREADIWSGRWTWVGKWLENDRKSGCEEREDVHFHYIGPSNGGLCEKLGFSDFGGSVGTETAFSSWRDVPQRLGRAPVPVGRAPETVGHAPVPVGRAPETGAVFRWLQVEWGF